MNNKGNKIVDNMCCFPVSLLIGMKEETALFILGIFTSRPEYYVQNNKSIKYQTLEYQWRRITYDTDENNRITNIRRG
jgi:hypothetical protein